ncbi:MAG TPA: glycosyltransferase [Burkholderiales bacterium]|nr:glycosyltransferase [Burkholderiales bacterium]
MNPDPAITVYIPTRNRPTLLKRAVTSALEQSYPHFELVIALDRPSEEARSMAGELAGAAARAGRVLRVVESDRPGACAARNCALAAATGEFATGLDDDDYFERNHLMTLAKSFDATRHAFIFTGRRAIHLDAAGARVETPISGPTGRLLLATLLRKNVVGNQVLTLTARMREVGGFDESLPAWQDYDLWLRLARRYGPAWGLPGHSYVFDQVSAEERISGDATLIEAAYRQFLEKHAEYAEPTLSAFLRLTRAAYGVGGFGLADAARVVVSAGVSRLSIDAACVYLNGLRGV